MKIGLQLFTALAMMTGTMTMAADTPKNALELDPNMAIRPANEDGLRFLSPDDAPLRLTGFLFRDRDKVYRRMPLKPAEPFSPGVENLAWNTAGGQVAFRTDSSRIVLKVKMRGNNVMYHMAQTGTAGFDLYAGEPGRQRFFGVTRFAAGAPEYTAQVFKTVRPKMREFTINFPLYAGVESVYIGLDEKAKVEAPTPWADDRPIVIYGTSITQGGCAARPGMAYTNILSRMLNRPVVNLGFSGNGKGEAGVAAEIARVANPAMFVLDYDANSGGAEKIAASMPVFIDVLRKSHPTTPILVISRIRPGGESLDYARNEEAPRSTGQAASVKVQRELVEKRRAEGDRNIYFLDGGTVINSDDWDEVTVDGSHPTDYGFALMARSIAPVVSRILTENTSK
ncbi:MAG: SGNH/GDSL hydrolase family protein [Victivallaceae bacterium]